MSDLDIMKSKIFEEHYSVFGIILLRIDTWNCNFYEVLSVTAGGGKTVAA